MLHDAREEGLVPSEQYAEKQSTADDGSFDKTLQSDISRQQRKPFSILSADAANCYNRIHHTIMALVFLSLGTGHGSIKAMLLSIQMMKFFLRTGWGESGSWIGGNPLKILHGMCQGNVAAPAAWIMLSSVLVNVYKSLGFGARMVRPINQAIIDIMGVLYVDDTDLYIMDDDMADIEEVWNVSQEALTTWGSLLISTGGLLKPEKCFYYLVDYVWEEGKYNYAAMQTDRRLMAHPLKLNKSPSLNRRRP